MRPLLLVGTVAMGTFCARAFGRVAQCYNAPYDVSGKFGIRKVEVFSNKFRPYQLGEIIAITHDVALFRFLLSDPEDEFNLKPCSTLQACYKYGVQPVDIVQRFYTPVTPNHTKGYFDLIVKRKPDGPMTKHLFGMHVGDRLLFRAVMTKVKYKPNRWNHIGMIAGGTGFTPMLQVIRHSLMDYGEGDEEDKTKLSFLFCNRTENHILLRGLFDQLAKEFPLRFRMFYCVDDVVRGVDKWEGFKGFVTKKMIQETMPGPMEEGTVILLCGPDHLLAHVAGTPSYTMHTLSSGKNYQPFANDLNNMTTLGGVLGKMGYDDNQVYRF